MDNLSSASLDSSSKTPFYVAIAAVILGLAGLGLGWMGFSSASALEAELQALKAKADTAAAMQQSLDANVADLGKMRSELNNISRAISSKLKGLEDELIKMDSGIRKNTIDAKTALKELETLKEAGLAAAKAPAPRPGSDAGSSDSDGTETVKGGLQTYTVQSGDYPAKIAAKFKITTQALLEANPGVEPTRMRIGQQLVIPAAK